MATSTRMKWPFPNEGADPWYGSFEGMVAAQDASSFGGTEAKNIILTGGGTISWSASTGLLTWGAFFRLNSASAGTYQTVEAGSAVLPNDGDFGYVRFVNGSTSNVTLALQTASSLPSTDYDRTLLLFYRRGARVFFRNGSVIQDGESAAVIDEGSGISAVDIEKNGTFVGATDTLNFIGPVFTDVISSGGQVNIFSQLAAASVEVTVTPYSLSASYRAFYVNVGSATTINLGLASGFANQFFLFKALTADSVTLNAFAGDTIEGGASYTFAAQNSAIIIHSASLDGGLTWDWYVVARTESAANTFSLTSVEAIVVGSLVACNPAGNAVLGDATLANHYPAIGVCVALGGSTVFVQPVGSVATFLGLTPGTTYYLGTGGTAVTTPPMGAFVAQPVLQAYSATSGVLLTGSPPIYL